MDYREFITKSLLQALDIANKSFGKVSGITKTGDNNQVLTETDLKISKLLISSIKQTYPTYNIIDEEAGVINNNSEFTWVIDPIDGTSNFSNGIPFFGIMIGLIEENHPIVGGIALPYFEEIYFAEKGKGSFLDNQQLHVTKETKLLHSLVAYQMDGHQENPASTKDETSLLAYIVLGIRNLRAFETCYDTTLLAQGKLGGYLNKTSKIWDNVAPQIIIEEAGGIYTDFYGSSVDYTNALARANDNFTVCAAAPELHKQLQEIIHGKNNI